MTQTGFKAVGVHGCGPRGRRVCPGGLRGCPMSRTRKQGQMSDGGSAAQASSRLLPGLHATAAPDRQSQPRYTRVPPSPYGTVGPPSPPCPCRAGLTADAPPRSGRPADRPGMAAPPPRGAAAAQSGPGRPRSAHGAALAPAPARPRAPGPARRGSPRGDSAPRLRPRSGPAPRKGGAELGVRRKKETNHLWSISLMRDCGS